MTSPFIVWNKHMISVDGGDAAPAGPRFCIFHKVDWAASVQIAFLPKTRQGVAKTALIQRHIRCFRRKPVCLRTNPSPVVLT